MIEVRRRAVATLLPPPVLRYVVLQCAVSFWGCSDSADALSDGSDGGSRGGVSTAERDPTDATGGNSLAEDAGAEGGRRGDSVTTQQPNPDSGLLPRRIRRLSNVELGNSIRVLLNTSNDYESSLPTDLRQGNFTNNEAQTVSSDWNAELERIAKAAAAEAVSRGLDELSPCPGQTSDVCAEEFIASLAGKAFRRDPLPVELRELFAVYATGVAEVGFARGLELAIAAMLQSASFVYITEIGDESGRLTGEEIASLLAYVTTRHPPTQELLSAAKSGALQEGGERGAQARKLLGTAAGQDTLSEMIVQWFAADAVLDVAKDDIPEFNDKRADLLGESRDFARVIVESHQADVATLLTADFTVASSAVAEYYGLSGSGELSLVDTPRRGLTTQAAFLAGHSSPTGSSPIRRGAAFMRQILCTDPPDPADVNLMVAPPQPDPSVSTRQLFAAHSDDPVCQGCHSVIDPIGFAFEEFDEGGRLRRDDADNNDQPIDASGQVEIAGESFAFENAAGFLSQVAQSDLAHRCVAKTAARYAFGVRSPDVDEASVALWRGLDSTSRTRLDEVLVKLIESDLFVLRRTP